jgi:hypothetical protein
MKREIKITVTLKPKLPESEYNRRRDDLADHVIEFVNKNLEKKFPRKDKKLS